MARAGRKRDPAARRRQTTRAGRSPVDHGTPELTAQRGMLVGAANAADQRASYALGVLNLNHRIGERQMEAGWSFAVLRWRLYGKPFAAARDYRAYLSRDPGDVPEVDIEGEAELRQRYDIAERALRNEGALVWGETRSVAVENRLPAWFLRQKAGVVRAGDAPRQQALVTGLDTLARVFRIGGQRPPDPRSWSRRRRSR